MAGGSRLLCGAGGSLALRPASCPRPPRSQWGVGALLQRLQEGSVGPQGACPSWRYSTCAPRATFPGTVPKAPGALGCPVPTPSAGASWTVTVWRADAAPGRGLGPRTRGAPIRRSALCPGMRGWPGEATLRGWARGRAAGEAPPRRQRCRWVALVGTPAFENTAESNVKVLAVARETAGGLKPGSAPLGMTWKWPPATGCTVGS